MKNIIKHSLLSAACAISAFALTGCDTDVESVDINQPGIAQQNPELYKTYLSNLRAYKQSNHKVMLAGFDNSNKLPFTQAQHINAVPDSVDYVILTNPEAVNEREIKEMAEIRDEKGTKSVYTVSFDDIKLQYDTEVSEFEAQNKADIADLDQQLADNKISQDDRDAKVAEIQARTYTDFKVYLADTVSLRLSYCDRFGFDGVIMSFRGKERITMTDDEKSSYSAWENMFLGMAADWADRHEGKELLLQGKPQFYADQTIFDKATFVLLPCQDISSASGMDYIVQKALGEGGIPASKMVGVVETTSLDASDKATGWWVGSVYATIGAAQFVATEHSGYDIAGLAVMNIQNDYYNSAFVYPHIRTAISIMNPNVKN